MFDNIAFSVVIGLVVIYLLYSLLTTIVGEILAGWMQIRALMLRTAIERMLNDGYYETAEAQGEIQPPGFWMSLFMLERPEFKASVAGKFYDYPSIKYLSRTEAEKPGLFKHTYPSYISSETFALTVINMLAEKGIGKTKIEQVAFALNVNSLHIQPETLKHIGLLLDDASLDFDAFKAGLMRWFEETMDRTTGWYKKRFSRILFWLGFVIAMTYNVDSIRIGKILANDKEARAQLVNMGVELTKDSSRYKDFVKGSADSVRPKAVLDSGYTKITKDISNANLILGLGWSLDTLTNEDTYDFDQKKDSGNFHLADSAGNLFQRNLIRQDTLESRLAVHRKRVDSIQRQVNYWSAVLLNIRAFPSARADSVGVKDSISRLQGERNDIARQFFLDSILLSATIDTVDACRVYLNRLAEGEFYSIRAVHTDGGTVTISGRERRSWLEKVWYFLVHITPVKSSFWGILITALMLSLGAPFWFGVLNKLVSLRSAGVKPEEKKKIPGLSSTNAVTPPVGLSNLMAASAKASTPEADLAEQTLDAFTEKIAQEQGIVVVALEGDPPHISVMVQTQAILNFLQAKYKTSFSLPAKPSLSIVYALAKPNTTHGAVAGGGIANKNLPNNQGTLGALLTRTDSAKTFILSCWHVMKDDHQLANAIIEKDILDIMAGGKPVIAEVEDGFFSADAGIDVGIAACTDVVTANASVVIKTQHRPVDAFDSFNGTPVELFGFASKKQKGTIFHHKANVRITYPGQIDYLVKDVFTITFKDPATGNAKSPTTGGDSGAVVVDGNGAPLGMIIGGNDVFSYAIKFTNIFASKLHSFSHYSFKI